MKSSEVQLSKPPAKSTSSNPGPTRKANGQSQQRPQSRDGGPTQEQIAGKAYQLYVESGCQDGRDTENWLRAEQLLSGHASSPQTQSASAVATARR
jgi:hypothetical protein